MARYHDTGTICEATQRACPLGLSDSDHIEAGSPEEFQEKLSERLGGLASTLKPEPLREAGEVLSSLEEGPVRVELAGELASVRLNGEEIALLYVGKVRSKEEAIQLLGAAGAEYNPSEAFASTSAGIQGGAYAYEELGKHRAIAKALSSVGLNEGERIAFKGEKLETPRVSLESPPPREALATEEEVSSFLKSSKLFDGPDCFVTVTPRGGLIVDFEAPNGTQATVELEKGARMGQLYSSVASIADRGTAELNFDSNWSAEFSEEEGLSAEEYALSLEEDEAYLRELTVELRGRGLA